MITLHHLEYSQSFRILWLLEELGVEYELRRYERDPETMLAPAAYKAISPLGTAPVIEHDGRALAESSAILEYVLDVHPADAWRPPPGDEDRVRHLFWFHAAQGSAMSLVMIEVIMTVLVTRSPWLLRPLMRGIAAQVEALMIGPRMNALLDAAEADLAKAPWFGGRAPTLADIALCYPMEAAAQRGRFEGRPRCRDWYDRVRARDAYRRAVEKDGRDTLIPPL